MTTSSASKDNPKSWKKTVKQSTLSSSLKTIMKYGGGVTGQKEDGKKTLSARTGITTGTKRQKGEYAAPFGNNNDLKDSNSATDPHKKEDKEKVNLQLAGEDQYQDDEDIDMIDMKVTDGDKKEELKWDDVVETMDIDSREEAIVSGWESEIQKLESELTSAATVEYKRMIEGRLQEAQRQLKQALLRIANKPKGSETEGGKVKRSKGIELVDLTLEENREATTNDGHDKKTEQTQDTVYDSRQDMDTFKWVTIAPMQKSPTAYIIGIAVGSTEKQDYELLNRKLGTEIGIEELEVSFQNINQVGVTQEFWKLANEKASIVSKDKFGRDHLKEKYRWAPNALLVYVPKKEMVSKAWKIMIKKYGKSDNGNDPIWPDGSSMRFLPVKGPTIKNEKTRMIVRKRMAYHIWHKANKMTIDTNFVNIDQTIDEFKGQSFMEIVLQSVDKNIHRVFSHINRAWSIDPSKERWALSIREHMYEQAIEVYKNLKDDLFDKYGPNINVFFNERQIITSWKDVATGHPQNQDDDDDWFDDDDDIDDIVKRGIVDSTFLSFLTGREDDDDKKSVASWGTGNTAYTELVTTQESAGMAQSSITQETPSLPDEEELEKKKAIVCVRMLMKGVSEAEIEDILDNKSPYELAFSGIRLPSWDPDKEVLMLMAIWQQTLSQNNEHEQTKRNT